MLFIVSIPFSSLSQVAKRRVLEDFESNKLMTGIAAFGSPDRDIPRNDANFVWQWKNDRDLWVSYSPSVQTLLEKTFHSPHGDPIARFHPGGDTLPAVELDVIKLCQTNTLTGQRRSMRRYPISSNYNYAFPPVDTTAQLAEHCRESQSVFVVVQPMMEWCNFQQKEFRINYW